jgi:protein-serine/threonine kinase
MGGPFQTSFDGNILFTPYCRHDGQAQSRMVQQTNQARVMNEVVDALDPSTTSGPEVDPLCIMNGNTKTPPATTGMACENAFLTPAAGFPGHVDNPTMHWGGCLCSPTLGNGVAESLALPNGQLTLPSPPSRERSPQGYVLRTCYFPLFRHPSPREQRGLTAGCETVEP